MRFKRISYHNYRCFLDDEIKFSEKGNKNINVLVGPNGGGKTETLFSFRWVLYGFDFSELREKEDTPWALNSTLYRELEDAVSGTKEECYVTLEFEHENINYLLTKRAIYTKKAKKIDIEECQEFSYYKPNKELSTPERDPEVIHRKLNSLIPASILEGILFDGERMKKLSSSDESSKSAIKGVISDITNVELIEKCNGYFDSVSKELTKELRKHASKTAGSDLQTILDQISALEEKYKTLEKTLEKGQESLGEYSARCNEISSLLLEYEKIKSLEEKRNQYRILRAEHESQLDEAYKDFTASLQQGYLLISDKLFYDVESIITKYDIPDDLTVPTVKSILEGTTCICGCQLDERARKVLSELIKTLPPDNIHSSLSEIIRQLRIQKNETMSRTAECYIRVNSLEEKIREAKRQEASLSIQISEFSDGQSKEETAKIRQLEQENVSKREKIAVLKVDLPRIKSEIDTTKKQLEELRAKRDTYSGSQNSTKVINSQIAFIDKCQKALKSIRETNKNTALDIINEKIDEAYISLSEDADLGRRLRIVQYDEARMYTMVVYNIDSYTKVINKWKKSGEYQDLVDEGFSLSQIKERAILSCSDSNSTGQSKMNTLSFVKAILDYSNLDKNNDGIEVKKSYPLLVDAPFSEIAGDNLTRSASSLHTFANQIILMLDNNKYEEVKPYIEKHISTKYHYQKTKGMNKTSIVNERGI